MSKSQAHRGVANTNAGSPGIRALTAVRPIWTGLEPASKRVTLEGRWLLHAGPPYADAFNPPAPVLASAVLACLHEGWAATETEAEHLIRDGKVILKPAQHYHCVTPLAALVSPSTTMIVVEDRERVTPPVRAPMGTLGGSDLRFGTRDLNILKRLAQRDGDYAGTLMTGLAEPIDLLPIALAAVRQGDDLHNRTTAATLTLVNLLTARFEKIDGSRRHHADELLRGLANTPLFFLTILMAAAKLMLSAAESQEPFTLVTRMGGNGETFGLSLAGRPDDWITMPAAAPQGPRLPGAALDSAALGAIGDSAVIDALGFGGQALHLAPEPRQALQPFLHRNATAESVAALLTNHPAFEGPQVRVGLDSMRVLKGEIAPVVTLGMVEKTGSKGLLGRGVFLPPTALFVNAVSAVAVATRGKPADIADVH